MSNKFLYKSGAKGNHTSVDEFGNLFVTISDQGESTTYISRFLDTNGDGTGRKEVTQNYAGSGTAFFIQPPSGEIFRLTRIIAYIQNSGDFRIDEYGGTGSPLSSGISFTIHDGAATDIMDGISILTNSDWSRFCYDVQLSDFVGLANFMVARWTFAKGGTDIRLIGDDNERFEFIAEDDFSDLDSQTFLIQGFIEDI